MFTAASFVIKKKKSINTLNISQQSNREANCGGFIGWDTIQLLKWMHLIRIMSMDTFIEHIVYIF